jgi:DMSO/TMAO reductase YedYZ molybdopterin-dependent catalytic subunit
MIDLPPGQRAVSGFPRFGVDAVTPPPVVPDGMTIEVTGPLVRRVSFAPSALTDLPRRSVVSDLHCVAGWSAIGLRWEGVAFADLYRSMIEPSLADGAVVRYLVFVGLDGYRSIVTAEDAFDGALIADRLDDEPLTPDHGAPVRLVSPKQYGYINAKHLCRIELYRSEPVAYFHPRKRVQRALQVLRPHPRARVAQEERRRWLPPWLVRRVYRALVKLPAPPLE